MVDFLMEHWGWLIAGSMVMSLGTLVGAPWILVRLPADYFVREAPPPMSEGRLMLRLIGRFLKNMIGTIGVLAGIAMVVLPGPGLVTVLFGLSLVDFPGKRNLQLRIIRRPRFLKSINAMRQKSGRPPLQLDPEEKTQSASSSMA